MKCGTWEMPSPNGKRWQTVPLLNLYEEKVFLTPQLEATENELRWYEVEMKPKPIVFQEHTLSSHIEKRKARPPTQKEVHCNNCYEIMPLSFPFPFTNCNNCLSPIVSECIPHIKWKLQYNR